MDDLCLFTVALRRDTMPRLTENNVPHFLRSLSAPALIDEMAHLPPKDFVGSIGKGGRRQSDDEEVAPTSSLEEKTFISYLGRDVCGTSVLHSSIQGFTRDTIALEVEIAAHLKKNRPRR